MNFELLVYILSILGVVYSVFVIYLTYSTARDMQKNFGILPAEINLNKEILVLVVAIAYIATYHLS